MSIDTVCLLYTLADTFSRVLDVEVCKETQDYLKKYKKKFNSLETTERMFYTNYGLKVANALAEYLDSVTSFELNTDEEADVVHDFRLIYQKKKVAHISMAHAGIEVNDLIPEKLMRICRYRKNSKISQTYHKKYDKICSNIYQKIKKSSKYSDMPSKSKDAIIFKPICELIYATIGKTRKCSNNLYAHLFSECDRIVLKLYKNRFKMYDFGTDKGAVSSYNLKVVGKDQIHITFSNEAEFQLKLYTNSYNIKKHISLKFHTKFANIDDMYSICSIAV